MAEYQRLRIRETEIDEVGIVAVVHFREPHISDLWEIEQLGLELYRLIEQRVRPKLVLDFSEVEFFSSAAIGKLISPGATGVSPVLLRRCLQPESTKEHGASCSA